MYDLIIIGAGPAGITASVYAARKMMNFLVVSKDVGGQTAWSGDIENYTGYQFITGPELTAKFQEHMRKYSVELKEGEEVIELSRKGDMVQVKTDKGRYEAKTAIVASGKRSRELGVPGEKEFKGRGLSYCATCDGPLFANKDVAVIGGGNAGLEAAIQLMKIAKHVYIIDIATELSGDPILQKQLGHNDKVSILNNTRVVAVFGDKLVSGVKIKTKDEEKTLPAGGVFVEIGLIPNSGFAKELAKNSQGEIKVDSYNRTNLPGVFAAGDVTDTPQKQIIIAAGEGAKAALSAFIYLVKSR